MSGGLNLYKYVANSPLQYNDPLGLYVNDMTGDKRWDDLRGHPLYENLQNDPNVEVNIVIGFLPGYAKTFGNCKKITIIVNPTLDMNPIDFQNMALHELVHAHQLRSGNFSYSDPSRRDFGYAEMEAYNYADGQVRR